MTAPTRRRITTLPRLPGLPACTTSECVARLGRDRPRLRANCHIKPLRGCGVADQIVDIDRSLGSATFEAGEPSVDPAPAGADEVDEERQVVHPCMPFGEKVSFDPLQPSNRLVEQASDLGDMAGDREHLGAEPVANGDADLRRN